MAESSQKQVENTVGKKEKLLIILTVFLIDLFCRHVKTRACLGNSYQLSSAAALSLGWSQNGVLGNGLMERENLLILLSTIIAKQTWQHACRKRRQKGHHFVFCPFLIYHVCLMLLHMYVIFTLHYCFLSKWAQYDLCCWWALKHHSFIHNSKTPSHI